jgi:hypothetical protein
MGLVCLWQASIEVSPHIEVDVQQTSGVKHLVVHVQEHVVHEDVIAWY